MENKISVVNIIVEDAKNVDKINSLLHEFSKYIIGRLGIPYSKKDVCVICAVMDAPATEVSSLLGKLGMLSGVTVKTITAKV